MTKKPKQDETEDAELNALLGKTLDLQEIVPTRDETKNEIIQSTPEDLETKILAETNDILEKAKYAVADVLMQVQTTPSDGDLVDGAAKLLKSYNDILGNVQKLYVMKEKFKQQVKLQTMKMMADDKMNQDNNATKIMMSREQVLAALANKKGKVIENNDINTENQ